MEDPRDAAAAQLDDIGDELERAVSHCRTAARRFREHLPPRAVAHAFAAWGHLHRATVALQMEAEAFAAKAHVGDAAATQTESEPHDSAN